jgi:hypothetical protein
MNFPNSNNTNSNFGSDNKDKDITDVLGFVDKLHEIEDDVSQNISETQIGMYNKLNRMLNFREKVFTNHLRLINENSYVEFSVKFYF